MTKKQIETKESKEKRKKEELAKYLKLLNMSSNVNEKTFKT